MIWQEIFNTFLSAPTDMQVQKHSPKNTNNAIFRATALGRPTVATCTWGGQRSSAPITQESVKTWPSGKPTSVVAYVEEVVVEPEETGTKEAVEAGTKEHPNPALSAGS